MVGMNMNMAMGRPMLQTAGLGMCAGHGQAAQGQAPGGASQQAARTAADQGDRSAQQQQAQQQQAQQQQLRQQQAMQEAARLNQASQGNMMASAMQAYSGLDGGTAQLLLGITAMMASVLAGLGAWVTGLILKQQQRKAEETQNGSSTNQAAAAQSTGARSAQASAAAPAPAPAPAPAAPAPSQPQAPADLANRFTVDKVAQLFPAEARSNIEKYLPYILSAMHEQGLSDPQMVMYALATIRPETSGFAPINEWAGGVDYEGREDLGNTQPGDGPRFMGRGFIQLTGRSNYTSYGEELGVDLVNNPELANDPQTAARILALYLKRHEGGIRETLNNGDFAGARAIVNGGSNGLDEFRDAFQQGQALGLA